MSIEKIRVENPQELEQMVTKEISQIEKDLTMICNNVQINDKTTLNVLCHDDNGQLVILQLSVSEEDTMLFQGMQSLDYVDKFKSFLKATYNKHKIDDKEKPRLILIAPSFSEALKRAVESMKEIRIDLYEWEYLRLGDHKGLRLQPIFTWVLPEKPEEKEEKPPEKKREPRPIKKKESEPTPKPETEEEPQPEPEAPREESPPPPEMPKEEAPPRRKLKLF